MDVEETELAVVSDQSEDTDIEEKYNNQQQPETKIISRYRHINTNTNTQIPVTDEEKHVLSKILEHESFRPLFLNILLMTWSCFQLPYDITGEISYNSLMNISLDIFLIAHIFVLIASVLCIIITFLSIYYIPFATEMNGDLRIRCYWFVIILFKIGTVFQIAATMLWCYTYCDLSLDGVHLPQCVIAQIGKYIFINAGIIIYTCLLLTAIIYNGDIPHPGHCCRKRQTKMAIPLENIENEEKNAESRNISREYSIVFKFNKKFRILYLTAIAFIGMLLMIIYGYKIYSTLDANYEALYVGYTWFCISSGVTFITYFCITFERYNLCGCISQSVQSVLLKMQLFFLMAAFVLIFAYSFTSKIPDAMNTREKMRLIGGMFVYCSIAILIAYEIFVNDASGEKKNGRYYSKHLAREYRRIPNPTD